MRGKKGVFSRSKLPFFFLFHSESLDTSPSPSFSSLSSNSTSFSSDDQLILPSSSSSSSSSIHTSSLINEIFSSIFPVKTSRNNKNFFHDNIISHHYKTLSSIIDNIKQQDFIRIHEKVHTTFLEHPYFQCIHIK